MVCDRSPAGDGRRRCLPTVPRVVCRYVFPSNVITTSSCIYDTGISATRPASGHWSTLRCLAENLLHGAVTVWPLPHTDDLCRENRTAWTTTWGHGHERIARSAGIDASDVQFTNSYVQQRFCKQDTGAGIGATNRSTRAGARRLISLTEGSPGSVESEGCSVVGLDRETDFSE